jgi:hypothetical protein
LSFRLNRPLSIPGFLSLRLDLSPEERFFSSDSRLARPWKELAVSTG